VIVGLELFGRTKSLMNYESTHSHGPLTSQKTTRKDGRNRSRDARDHTFETNSFDVKFVVLISEF
jgi:hypothetical protein